MLLTKRAPENQNKNKAQQGNFIFWGFKLHFVWFTIYSGYVSWTLCGRQSIYRSAGRATLRLNCKQDPSRDYGWPGSAHLQPPNSSFSKKRRESMQAAWQLHHQAAINPPRLIGFESRRGSEDAGGWRNVYCNAYFQNDQNNKTHSLPFFTSPVGNVLGGGEGTRKRQPFVQAYFSMRGRPWFVYIKALIKTVFCSRHWVTPLFLLWLPWFGSSWRSNRRKEKGESKCGNVSLHCCRGGQLLNMVLN